MCELWGRTFGLLEHMFGSWEQAFCMFRVTDVGLMKPKTNDALGYAHSVCLELYNRPLRLGFTSNPRDA